MVDGDGDPDAATATVRDHVHVPLEVVVIDPEIEAWFYPDANDPRSEARAAASNRQEPYEQYVGERARSANLVEFLKSAPGFLLFHDAIIRSAGVAADS